MKQPVFKVGRNCPNFGADVQSVADALAKIPAREGGAEGGKPLVAGPQPFEGGGTPELVGAIERFQKVQFGPEHVTGVVEPESATFYRMWRLTTGQPLQPIPGGQRYWICQRALEYVGAVSDQGIPPGQPRKGGDVLKRICTETVIGAPAWWPDPTKLPYDYGGQTYKITKLQGVLESCMRVPQGKNPKSGANQGMSWCGVFATWIWQLCGLRVMWEAGVGPVAEQVKVAASSNFRALAPGDILVNKGGEVHHYLVLSVSTGKAPSFESVDGNSNYQAIVHQDKWNASNAAYFYSYDSVTTRKAYGPYPGPSVW